MSGRNTQSSELTKAVVVLLSSFLSSPWTRKRAPYRIWQSVQAAQSSPTDKTSRIFLDNGGFKAWLAYYLATPGQAHYSGRQQQQQLINELHNLPVEDRISIAQIIAGVEVHPSAVEPIQAMEKQAMDGLKSATDTVTCKRRRR